MISATGMIICILSNCINVVKILNYIYMAL